MPEKTPPPSLLNHSIAPKTRSKRLLAALTTFIYAISVIVPPILAPQSAYAQEYPDGTFDFVPSCGGGNLGDWDWPERLKNDTGLSGSSLGMSDFNPETSSYIMWQTWADATSTPKRQIYKGLESSTGIVIGYDDVNHDIIIRTKSISNNWTDFEVRSEPRGKVPSDVYQWPSGYPGTYIGHGITPTSTTMTIPQENINCIMVAKNVQYESSWQFRGLKNQVAYDNEAGECEALQIGCWIGKAFDGINSGFQTVGTAIVTAITWLFVPSSQAVNIQVASLREFLDQKLGFILYPFTFTVTLWNAIISTTDNWCTPSSCVKNFGNFMGSPYTIDFFKMNSVVPSLFSFIQNVVRVTTLLGLMHLARTKYQEVTQT